MVQPDREPVTRLPRMVEMVVLALVILPACANGITVELTPVAPPLVLEPEASSPERIWAITQGGCGDPMSTVEDSGAWGTQDRSVIPAGRHCIRTLTFARFVREPLVGHPPCRVLTAGATEVTTPAQTTVRVDERLVAPDGRPVFDRLLRDLAMCDPMRDPARCSCAYSQSAEGECIQPVAGSVLALAAEHGCSSLGVDRRPLCWGRPSSFGAPGGDTYIGPTNIELPAELLGSIESIEVGPGVTCVRSTLGAVGCVGDGLAEGLSSPPLTTAGGGAVVFDDFAVGDGFWCGVRVLRDRSQLVCDGRGGPVTDTVIDLSARPTLVSLAAGARHLCAVDAEETVYCLGAADRGQLGVGASTSSTLIPVALPACAGDSSWVEVAASGDVTCARTRRGSVACWGDGRDPGCVGTDGFGATSTLSAISVDGQFLCGEFTRIGGVTCTEIAMCTERDWTDCPRVVDDRRIGNVSAGGGVVCGTTDTGTIACLPTIRDGRVFAAATIASSDGYALCPVNAP